MEQLWGVMGRGAPFTVPTHSPVFNCCSLLLFGPGAKAPPTPHTCADPAAAGGPGAKPPPPPHSTHPPTPHHPPTPTVFPAPLQILQLVVVLMRPRGLGSFLHAARALLLHTSPHFCLAWGVYGVAQSAPGPSGPGGGGGMLPPPFPQRGSPWAWDATGQYFASLAVQVGRAASVERFVRVLHAWLASPLYFCLAWSVYGTVQSAPGPSELGGGGGGAGGMLPPPFPQRGSPLASDAKGQYFANLAHWYRWAASCSEASAWMHGWPANLSQSSLLCVHHTSPCATLHAARHPHPRTPEPAQFAADPGGRHCQVGGLAGAAHLLRDNTDVLR
jgi:hypothetical protein